MRQSWPQSHSWTPNGAGDDDGPPKPRWLPPPGRSDGIPYQNATPINESIMPRKLIAIVDLIAQDIAGQPIIFAHDAPAIRFFEDVYDGNQSLKAHAADYELRELAVLEDDLTLTPTNRVIITGTTLAAIKESAQAVAS